MRKLSLFILSVFIIATGACGGSGSDNNNTPSGDTVTISGTLGIDTITNNISLKTPTPASGYTVVAIDNSSGKTYTTTANSSGFFELEDVPTDGTYVVSLISNGSYVGPTVFAGSGNEVTTGVTPTADLDLGSITVDTSSGYAKTDTDSSAAASAVTAVAENGVPKGAGSNNNGKETLDDITNRDDGDMDQDGIPNLFDADEDNDGVRNGIVGDASGSEVISDNIEAVYIASNIWARHGEAQEPYNEIAMWIVVSPKEGKEDLIQSAKCASVPSSIADTVKMRQSESLGIPEGTYQEWGLWSTENYAFFKATSGGNTNKWLMSIQPGASMNIGDTFQIEVTYTDSTTENFFISTSYVLESWAAITKYTDSTEHTLSSSAGKRDAPAEINSASLTITFSEATDEDGLPLEGLLYSVEYGPADCSSGTCGMPTSEQIVTINEEDITDNGDGTRTAALTGLQVGSSYYVVPVAETTGTATSQRNGEETWFTRTE